MDAIALMDGFGKRLKAAEKKLQRLEKQAKTLAEHDKDIRAERESFEQEIEQHEGTIAELKQEREQLKHDFAEAQFEGDVQEQKRITARRKQIDQELQQHQTDIRRLRESLDSLEDTEQDAAELAVQLDALNFGKGWSFATELRNVLTTNESQLRSRVQKTRNILPRYSPTLYAEIKAELEPDPKQGSRSVEELNFAKMQQAREAKDAAAAKQFVGVGSFGGPRRTEPDERDFSS